MEILDSIEQHHFEEFIAKHEEVNFLQSQQWGKAHQEVGDGIIHTAIRRDGQIVAAWQGIIKDAKRGRYLEIAGGPVLDWTDQELINAVIKQVKEIAKKHKCVFARFRPPVKNNAEINQILAKSGAKKSPMHLHAEHTNILDITAEEEKILAGMRRQTRYDVRRVAKREVAVEVKTPTAQDIDQFYDLQMETAKRHGFIQSSRQFFQAMRLAFGDDMKLYKAHKNGQLLNLAIVLYGGKEADYFEAASTPEARSEPGAYGIVWQAIRDAKLNEMQRFNFWGIAYTNDPKHRYAGVTTFKRGFGGEDTEYVPAHDIVVDKVRYQLNWLVETARRKKRGL